MFKWKHEYYIKTGNGSQFTQTLRASTTEDWIPAAMN